MEKQSIIFILQQNIDKKPTFLYFLIFYIKIITTTLTNQQVIIQ